MKRILLWILITLFFYGQIYPVSGAEETIMKKGSNHVSIPVKMITPVPVWCVGSYNGENKPNVMTASWVGIVCSRPPCVAVSLRKATYTYHNIMAQKAFTVSLPSSEQVKYADYFGMVSGKNTDKFAQTGITPVKSDQVNAPYPKEFPLVLECNLLKTIELGLHTMFVGEIVGIKAQPEFLDGDKVDTTKLAPFFYAPSEGVYYKMGPYLADGFSAGRELMEK